MKNKMPSEGLRLGRDSGSILCDTLKKWRFRTSWGGETHTKLFLEDYVIMDSKIEKQTVQVSMADSNGNVQEIPKQVPGKVLAIRFKKIIQTFTTTDFNGEEQEMYTFEKTKDEHGQPTSTDAEFYTFTGSKIMIDQATRDFTREDLPVPTVIQQLKGKDGKDYTKFT